MGVFKGGPTGFFWLGFGGWKFGMCGWLARWLASPCLHAMFSGEKNGGKILRRFFRSLWKSFSLWGIILLAGSGWKVFSQTSGVGSGPRVVRLLKLRASFLPFVQFPEKDKESEEDNGELILTRTWEDEEHGTKKKKQQLWWERERERESFLKDYAKANYG